jgi:hypothetical protein
MIWLHLLLLWFLLASLVMTAFAIVARRRARAIGVLNLPAPANDRGASACKLRLFGAATTFLALTLLLAPTGHAQMQLPPLHVEAAPESCVDVQVEGARSLSYDCLNKTLNDSAGSTEAGPHPFDVKDAVGNGAPTTVGTFSYTGTSIRMGNAFGKSAIPQRPQPPSFTSALITPGAK